MEEQGGGAKIVLAILGILLLLVITPIILFLGAGDDAPDADPNAPCVIEGTPIGDTEKNGKPTVKIPEQYRDGDPMNDEQAANDTGIVYTLNGPYIFVIYTDHPYAAVEGCPHPLKEMPGILCELQKSIHNASNGV